MHRLNAKPGGWNSTTDGVIILEQTPASIVFLTAADTDIQTLAACLDRLPRQFPTIRVANLLQLQQQLSIDSYADTILSHAKVIIIRLLGGRSYWSYGLEIAKEISQETDAFLLVLPGDDRPDPTLMSHSTVALTAVTRLWHYLTEGGQENWINALKFVSDLCFQTNYNTPPPQVVPRLGFYAWQGESQTTETPTKNFSDRVGILFYRAHYLAGNLLPIDALCRALQSKKIEPIPIFVTSLRDLEVQEALLNFLRSQARHPVQLLLDTTSFSLSKIGNEDETKLWQQLNIPVLQVILSSTTQETWQESFQGLTPRDVAMNVALPEVDGKIVTRAISFKSVKTWNKDLETDVVVYQPKSDRVNFVVDLAANWLRLRQTPVTQRKIAIVLANYPNRDGRIANGVGLDTPASCLEILKALQNAGYFLENIPNNSDELIEQLTAGITNDPESYELRSIYQKISLEDYQQYFSRLPKQVQTEISDRWGNPSQQSIAIAGRQLGNIFIGIQPSRGYDRDPSLNYHAPDLEPTHEYLAYYYWLREKFGAHAIVHLGKHGNLEWLPGKSIALSETCYPEIALATLPNFYPFIVNDPGEGSQAKRRSHAVILDHLTPPLTRAELYGDLEKLESLIDEYYEAQNLDPSRLKIISDRIAKLIDKTNLNIDLGIDIDRFNSDSLTQFLTLADGYLCELKEAQIRDGLHVFGQCPQGTQLRDLILSIARSPSRDRTGITRAIAQDLNLDIDPLAPSPSPSSPFLLPPASSCYLRLTSTDAKFRVTTDLRLTNARTQGEAIALIEQHAAELIENPSSNTLPKTQKELDWIKGTLLPALQKTPQEITHLLDGLDGKYVPSGASGAPTRGRPEVLPTGRNFYSVDIRAIPTETAWDVGRKAAEALIERYTQDCGEYPRTLAISIWGTSTMRTGGDDVAQVLALLGVRPVWDNSSRRVIDFEILSPSALGRPRVDVTVRVSGFFRDSFPNILELLYDAIKAVSSLKEEKEINPLAAQVQAESEFWEQQGIEKERAKEKACYRIFGSKPGAYGAGLQGIIEAQNWQSDRDLARAYINWSCYAYDRQGNGRAVPEIFEQRLQQLQIILHNQDNREHDILDSDDYYQFQGGLTVAARVLTGKNPQTYFGDNSLPSHPKIRLLREEIARVYRSRVINPKWIAGVMRHGYKGAFEIAATVDYLFAYDATANCVEDFMYEGVTEAYLFDERVRQFIAAKNPWALRDISERLLEAHQRNLWRSPTQETLERLRAIVHQAEGDIEAR
jgi:cobaltochelatase CobN